MKPGEQRPQDVNKALLSAYLAFNRGVVFSGSALHFLVFMLLKYISDTWGFKRMGYSKRFAGDPELIARKMNRERFILGDHCSFDRLYECRHDPSIGELVDKALADIEVLNPAKLGGLFGKVSFNSEDLGPLTERNARLCKLIQDFADPLLNFCYAGQPGEIARNAGVFILETFATARDRREAGFFTPAAVATLMAELLTPQNGARIADPSCGCGNLLTAIAQKVRDPSGDVCRDFSLFGRDSREENWMMAKANLIFHNLDAAQLDMGGALRSPVQQTDGNGLQFDLVVSRPPGSWRDSAYPAALAHRFQTGVPARKRLELAVTIDILKTLSPSGKAAVLVPHGVLFRGGVERDMRREMVEGNVLDAVVSLPANLLFDTGIPMAILVFRKNRPTSDVLFIDASKGLRLKAGKKRNHLSDADVAAIAGTYATRTSRSGYSRTASLADIRANDFDLSMPRYVNPGHHHVSVDRIALQDDIRQLEAELALVREQIHDYLGIQSGPALDKTITE